MAPPPFNFFIGIEKRTVKTLANRRPTVLLPPPLNQLKIYFACSCGWYSTALQGQFIIGKKPFLWSAIANLCEHGSVDMMRELLFWTRVINRCRKLFLAVTSFLVAPLCAITIGLAGIYLYLDRNPGRCDLLQRQATTTTQIYSQMAL